MHLNWLLSALVACATLSVLHKVALDNSWYWQYRWLDTPMHLFAGVAIGLALVGILGRFRPYLYMLGIAAAALGWEVFEYVFKISTNQPFYVLDTSHDILNDVIGACLIYIIARLTVWQSK